MNVSIRPLIINDAYTSVKWRNDKEVFKLTGNVYDHEITLESELAWIKDVISRKNEYRCAILADGEYVGNIYLTDILDNHATYHIFIGEKKYWGTGVARKASELIIRYGFDVLNLKAINLEVRLNNLRAIKLYERLGFKKVSKDEEYIYMIINN